ncbi:MAG: hypothetical protein NTV86_14505 [Planctomycetota bacterium]|nr:hypothetical protein [Planctomycetota bacterium]
MTWRPGLLENRVVLAAGIALVAILAAGAALLAYRWWQEPFAIPPPAPAGDSPVRFVCGQCNALFTCPRKQVEGYIAGRWREGTTLGIDCPVCRKARCADMPFQCPGCGKMYLSQAQQAAMGQAQAPEAQAQPVCPQCGAKFFDALRARQGEE